MNLYEYAAYGMLAIHILFVCFICLSVPAVAVGGMLSWGWVRHSVYRNFHALIIGLVAFEAVFNLPCPITLVENFLREKASLPAYGPGGCLEYWFDRVWGITVDVIAFNTVYFFVFAGFILLYWLVPPRLNFSQLVRLQGIKLKLTYEKKFLEHIKVDF